MVDKEYTGYEDSDSSDGEETTNSTEKETEIEDQREHDETEQAKDNIEPGTINIEGEEVIENNEYSCDPRNLIQDVFELFQLEFQSSVSDSFQRVSDSADKFQYLDQELYELSNFVSNEHYTLKEKKRRAVDSVESLKKKLLKAATAITDM